MHLYTYMIFHWQCGILLTRMYTYLSLYHVCRHVPLQSPKTCNQIPELQYNL